jgi:thymidylate synthase (FAD)
MGTDLTVVNAARVSFDKESDWQYDKCTTEPDKYGLTYDLTTRSLSERDTGLIHFLAREGHFTPFTHCIITLRETVPIFVARQRFKHMVGFSYNEVSRRYVDDEPEFFIPEVWRKRAPDKKQGSSDEEITILRSRMHGDQTVADAYERLLYHAQELYEEMIEVGVAPEQARMVLPQSMYTSYYVTGSLYAFARAYNLRMDSHAQAEIQDLAAMWDKIIDPLFPVSWEALTS